jgi:hypothetical protein
VFADLGYGTALQVPGYGDHLEATIDSDIRTRQSDAPEGFEDVITVDDRDDAVARADRLGATVLGQEDSMWTKTVTIRDPQGAVFTASQFTPPTAWE